MVRSSASIVKHTRSKSWNVSNGREYACMQAFNACSPHKLMRRAFLCVAWVDVCCVVSRARLLVGVCCGCMLRAVEGGGVVGGLALRGTSVRASVGCTWDVGGGAGLALGRLVVGRLVTELGSGKGWCKAHFTILLNQWVTFVVREVDRL